MATIWDSCEPGVSFTTPDFYREHHPFDGDHFYWMGVRHVVGAIVPKCHIIGITPQQHVDFHDWVGVAPMVQAHPHPSNPALLTRCLVAGGGSSSLAGLRHMLRLQPHPGTGYSRAYFVLLEGGLDEGLGQGLGNDKECYLHRLLCFLYHGPSPHPDHVVGHLCDNKLCICPWHLAWMTQAENVQMGKGRKRKRAAHLNKALS